MVGNFLVENHDERELSGGTGGRGPWGRGEMKETFFHKRMRLWCWMLGCRWEPLGAEMQIMEYPYWKLMYHSKCVRCGRVDAARGGEGKP